MMKVFTYILCTWAMLTSTAAYHVLVIPFPWYSHYKQMEIICTRLQERGHRVTVIIPKTEAYSSSIALEKIVYDVGSIPNDTFLSIAHRRIINSEGFHVNWLFEQLTIQETLVQKMLEDKSVLNVVKTADFAIVDTAYVGSHAFIDYFNIPFFALSPWGLASGLYSDYYGVPGFPSYIPTFALYQAFEAIAVSDQMSITERALNTLGYLLHKLYRDPLTFLYFYQLRRRYMKTTLPNMYRKTSLVLIPMDFAIEYPIPLPPNVKMIGPLTVAEGRPLSATFNHILSNSVSGTILVNYGGTFALPNGWLMKITKLLLALDENVIWRFQCKKYLEQLRYSFKSSILMETDNKSYTRDRGSSLACGGLLKDGCIGDGTFPRIEDHGDYLMLEEKLYIFDWIPQNDLLSHPDVVVFMSHCGTNSIYESAYHKVPQLCSPLFGDHFDNAGRVKSRQLGKIIRWDEMNEVVLKNSIKELKSSSEIKASLCLASKRLKNRKRSSADEAADIVETYMEYGDSSFLRPRGADMSFIQLYCLDIAFLVGLGIYAIILFTRWNMRLRGK